MIKRILLGLGGTPYTSIAIQRAVSLAKRFEAEITGVTMFDVERLPGRQTEINRARIMTDTNSHNDIISRPLRLFFHPVSLSIKIAGDINNVLASKKRRRSH